MYDRRFHKWGVSKYVKRTTAVNPVQTKSRTGTPGPVMLVPSVWSGSNMPADQDCTARGAVASQEGWPASIALMTVTADHQAYDDSVESQSSESSEATVWGPGTDGKDESIPDACWFKT